LYLAATLNKLVSPQWPFIFMMNLARAEDQAAFWILNNKEASHNSGCLRLCITLLTFCISGFFAGCSGDTASQPVFCAVLRTSWMFEKNHRF
jgi:hypothetical protein